MGLISLIYLEGKVIYKCECNAHLTHGDFLDSKNYRAEVNIFTGICEDRRMSSGLHTVCDIFCCFCLTKERAYDEENKFKEGKYILERKLIYKFVD